MKRFALVLLCLIAFYTFRAQEKTNYETPYPKSVVELGAGIGPNFGIFGGQMLIGYQGSGVLLAAGTFKGQLNYAIGLQFGHEWFYANISWATVGLLTDGNTGTTEQVFGIVIMTGAKINLLKAKTLYLQLGVGYQVSSINTVFGSIDNSAPTFGVGIGYRFADKKK